MEAKIHSGPAKEVAVFGAGVCRYLELNQEYESVPGFKHN